MKSVICSPPPSVELRHELLGWLPSAISKRDEILQGWAIKRADKFSEPEWQELQLSKIKSILLHASRSVKFWKKIFKDAHFDPTKFKIIKDLEKLPITSRADIKKIRSEELTSCDVSPSRYIQSHTSGSTGEPLSFFQDARDAFRRRVNTTQELRYAGFAPSYDTAVVVIGLENHPDLDGLGSHFGMKELENQEIRIAQIYRLLETKQPLLITGSSILKRLMSLISYDKYTLNDLRLRGIFFRGESLNENDRRRASELFRCDIFSTYGSRECSLLGIECTHHSVHLVPWMNYTEVTDSAGKSLPIDTPGEIVVTFFENYVCPFIRYRIGDRGVIRSKLCSCGRKSKVVELFGREQIFIGGASNVIKVPLLNLTRYLDEYWAHAISQYQFIQADDMTLRLRYVPIQIANETNENEIRHGLSAQANFQVDIIIEAVRRIMPLSDGKTPVFIKAD